MVAAAALALAGCSSAGTPAPATTPSASTYLFPSRTVRPSETPLATATVVSGPVSVAVIGLRAHLTYAVGTHADFTPRGEYDRLRVVVQNDDRTFLYLTLADIRLVTADGTVHRPDAQAMAIKRQPETVDIGSLDRAEFDLWYDVPTGSRLRALRLTGFDPVREIPLPPG
jgi:hypothetical protein